jgi:hypothetical protein
MAGSFNMAQAFDISAGSTTEDGPNSPRSRINPGKFSRPPVPVGHRLPLSMGPYSADRKIVNLLPNQPSAGRPTAPMVNQALPV